MLAVQIIVLAKIAYLLKTATFLKRKTATGFRCCFNMIY